VYVLRLKYNAELMFDKIAQHAKYSTLQWILYVIICVKTWNINILCVQQYYKVVLSDCCTRIFIFDNSVHRKIDELNLRIKIKYIRPIPAYSLRLSQCLDILITWAGKFVDDRSHLKQLCYIVEQCVTLKNKNKC